VTPKDRTETLSRSRLHQLLHQLLDEGLAVEIKAAGASMSPFVRAGDLLTLTPRGRRAVRRGDVVAFLVDGGSLVIHRVVAAEGAAVRTRGDALGRGDRPVAAADVLGIVVRVERRGRRVRFGLGPERALVAWLSERGFLAPLLRPWRWLTRRR
jgi:hypothetical protein